MTRGSAVRTSKNIYLGNQQTKEDGSKEHSQELFCEKGHKGKEEGAGGEVSGLHTMDLK